MKLKKLSPFLPFSLNQNQFIQIMQGFQMYYGSKSIRNFMVSYNILILSVYVLSSIFKENKPDFRYNKVSASVSLQEISLIKFLLYILNANVIVLMMTQEIAGSSV